MALLNNEEKESVLRLINQKPGILRSLLHFTPFIFPSLALAIYGCFKQDFLAAIIAYGGLLVIVVFYLVSVENYSTPLRSALKKYNTAVKE